MISTDNISLMCKASGLYAWVCRLSAHRLRARKLALNLYAVNRPFSSSAAGGTTTLLSSANKSSSAAGGTTTLLSSAKKSSSAAGGVLLLLCIVHCALCIAAAPRPQIEWNPAIGFRYTNGVTDPANHQYSEKIKNWCDWSGWVDGKWTKDEEFLIANGIKMPDFSFLTNSQWENPLAFMLPDGQKRQPTHTIEHTVYAIPGRPVVLYPYYEMERQAWENYCLRYAHWYDWKTGNTPTAVVDGKEQDVIDFRVDPTGVFKSDSYGYFGIPGLNGYDFHIKSVKDWADFCDWVNTNGLDINDERYFVKVLIDADLDFKDYPNPPQLAWSGHDQKNDNGTTTFIPHPFRGLIDGAGHTISNYRLTNVTDYSGFVKYISGGCEIRNLAFDSSCTISANTRSAMVVGCITSTDMADIKIANIYSEAKVNSSNTGAWAMGGLLGYNNGFKGKLHLTDIRIGGEVMPTFTATNLNKDNFTGLGCFNSGATVALNRIYIDAALPTPGSGNTEKKPFVTWGATVGGPDGAAKPKDCYFYTTMGNFQKLSDTNETTILTALSEGFEMRDSKALPKIITLRPDPVEVPHTASYATTPVFLYPETADRLKAGGVQKLPEEYTIAADFSQSFTVKDNMTKSGDTYTEIAEPIIHFRHIFHIKDGCELARRMSENVDSNAKYVRQHTRILAARANKDMQVRLANAYPTKPGIASELYYISQTGEYLPAGGVKLRVYDREGKQHTTHGFSLDSKVKGYGPVVADGVEYVGADDEYARMLCYTDALQAVKSDRWTVQLIACDLAGNIVNIKGSSEPLILEKYEIDMLGDGIASFVTAKEFYDTANDAKYADMRPEALENTPNTRLHDEINFDEYSGFTKSDAPKSPSASYGSDYVVGSGNKFWYKWPMTLTQGEYAFGYDRATGATKDDRYEYNEYIISTHSDFVPWKSAVEHSEEGELYDRYWYESSRQNKEQTPGFFYYVNAASDPGTICTLRAKDICMGSTVKISAWIAEFSPYKPDEFFGGMTETANVAFTFVAVKGNGERVNIHTFITGYVAEYAGQWMHVYYEFTPRTADFDLTAADIDHYELLLVNNCRGSNGGDYAIDDITVYIQNPTVVAKQLSEVCKPSDTRFEVMVGAPFDTLLQVLFEKRDSGKTMEIYYTFIDKDIFDANYEKYTHDRREIDPGDHAWEDAVVRYDYDGLGEGYEDSMYGTLRFNTTFEENNKYAEGEKHYGLASYLTQDGVDYIVFNTFPYDENLRAEKEYYISMSVKDETGYEPFWYDFDIFRPCTMQSVFTVIPTSVVKIDGEILDDDSRTEYCENMRPTVQVNLKGYDPVTNEILVVDQNALFDWYDGTLDEYYDENRDGLLLSDALFHLHAAYPELEDIERTLAPKAGLTQEMIDYIADLAHPMDENEQKKLTLCRHSYTFDPLRIPEAYDEEGNRIDHGNVYALAIPIEHITEDGETEYRICTIPTQVGLTVRERSPFIAHGFRDIPYPKRIVDAPIRASLRMLQAASTDTEHNFEEHDTKLNVPLRTVTFSGVTEATDMRRKTDTEGRVTADLTLIYTDDPQYEKSDIFTAGEITGITATGQEDIYDAFECVFDSGFIFKEGYAYQFKFPFEENNDLRSERCPGEETFTIKVVPEYLKWMGTTNFNFNNDSNWRRIEAGEAYTTKERSGEDFFSDGSNKTTHAFAPLDFTKVIITEETPEPRLFCISGRDVKGVKHFENELAPWSYAPSARSATESLEGYAFQFEADAATCDVEYDLACFRDGHVWCRPWYANTCQQIHFKPQTQIIGQKWLEYERAWVDMRLTPYYWHLVASPLKETFAGDFYLPTKGAQEKSPLFEDIYYSVKLNDRFAPAVYQRGYRLGKATVYQLDNTATNVAYEAGWSNVFNDVLAKYGGEGDCAFSLKSDPSDASDREDGDDVIFRLPKADEAYTYYDQFNKASDPLISPIPRTAGQYRLNDAEGEIKAYVKSTNRFILVGNPLMAHLDMERFLKANEEKVEQKYWIVSELTQLEGMFDDMHPDEPLGSGDGTIPPMKAFFVMLKDGVTLPIKDTEDDIAELTLKYTPAMASIGPEPMPIDRPGVKIEAICDGEVCSSATIIAGEEGEEMPMLDNTRGMALPGAVYAISGHQAMSIARRGEIEGTEIGVAKFSDECRLTLRFNGISAADDLYLFDKRKDSYTPIYEGMAYDVDGSQTGLYIQRRDAEPTQELCGSIVWRYESGELIVNASMSGADISLQVADTDGKNVAIVNGIGECRQALEPGVYIIHAKEDGSELATIIMLR